MEITDEIWTIYVTIIDFNFFKTSMASSSSRMEQESSPNVVFPKYNNYLQDKRNFDPYTKIMVPLNVLGIKYLRPGNVILSK